MLICIEIGSFVFEI